MKEEGKEKETLRNHKRCTCSINGAPTAVGKFWPAIRALGAAEWQSRRWPAAPNSEAVCDVAG